MNKEQMKPRKERREPVIHRSWHEDRSLCLGGAGASLVVLLTTLQLAVSQPKVSYSWSIGCASIAMMVWVCLWQVGDTDAFWRSKYPDKSNNTPITRSWGPCLFSIAISFLFVAILFLIATASAGAAWAFGVAAGISVAIAIKHSVDVQKHMRACRVVPRRLYKRK